MLLMTPAQILFAIRKGLEENILPELKRNYAQVQLLSTLSAIRELENRLEHGDPMIDENTRYEAAITVLAKEVKPDSLQLSAKLSRLLKGLCHIGDPRERNRTLKESLYQILSEAEDKEALQILRMISKVISTSLEIDMRWLCPEAIASLQG